jgi:tetratricopeptide (TPR) repeat protein
MKKLVALLFLVPAMAMAQKEIKPNLSKAEGAWKANKLDEAKAIIDVSVASQEFMVDAKKGVPSKNAAKAWYLKGVIYAALDSTKNPKFQALSANAFDESKAAFEKSKEIDQGKSKGFVNLPDAALGGFERQYTIDEVNSALSNAYFNRSLRFYEEDRDYGKAFTYINHAMYFAPADTFKMRIAGVYFGPAAKEFDKSIAFLENYLKAGGTMKEAYQQLIALYSTQKKSEEALAVIRKAKEKYPDEAEFSQSEIAILYDLGRLPEARASIEKKIAAGGADRSIYYNLGFICNKMKDMDCAKKAFKDAIKLDGEDFDSYAMLADISYKEVGELRKERGAITGSSDADLKKRKDLFGQIGEKLRESLPYWEKCYQLKGTDENVLYGLLSVYGDLYAYDESFGPKMEALKKKMKGMGLEVD